VGKSVSQTEMAKAIKDLKVNLISSKNVETDEELCKQIVWIENKDERIKFLSEIILFTFKKGSGKNNLRFIKITVFLIFEKNYIKLMRM